MENNIVHRHFFQHSPEAVWEFLTDPELLGQWLMKNDFRPVAGHRFQFHTKSRPGFDGTVYCEVLEVKPFEKLSYSWKGGPGKGRITLDSVVTWTLTSQAGGTELLLEHTGFKGFRMYISYLVMNKGWSLIVKKRLPKKMEMYQHEPAQH